MVPRLSRFSYPSAFQIVNTFIFVSFIIEINYSLFLFISCFNFISSLPDTHRFNGGQQWRHTLTGFYNLWVSVTVVYIVVSSCVLINRYWLDSAIEVIRLPWLLFWDLCFYNYFRNLKTLLHIWQKQIAVLIILRGNVLSWFLNYLISFLPGSSLIYAPPSYTIAITVFSR